MSLWTDYESKISRRSGRDRGMGWTRRAVFYGVPNATAESLVPPEWSFFPGEGGQFGACLVQSTVERESTEGGTATIVLDYRPLRWDEWLESHPNKAIVFPSSAIKSKRVRRTAGGVMLEGPDPDDATGRKSWEIVSGDNVQFYGMAVYELYSIIDNRDIYFFPYASKVGSYNNLPMHSFPLTPLPSKVGQFLLIGLQCEVRPAAKRLWTTRYRFLLHEEPTSAGWATPVVSRQLQVSSVQVPVINDDGEGVGTNIMAVLAETGERNTVNLIPGANFSPLDAMTINSW